MKNKLIRNVMNKKMMSYFNFYKINFSLASLGKI